MPGEVSGGDPQFSPLSLALHAAFTTTRMAGIHAGQRLAELECETMVPLSGYLSQATSRQVMVHIGSPLVQVAAKRHDRHRTHQQHLQQTADDDLCHPIIPRAAGRPVDSTLWPGFLA